MRRSLGPTTAFLVGVCCTSGCVDVVRLITEEASFEKLFLLLRLVTRVSSVDGGAGTFCVEVSVALGRNMSFCVTMEETSVEGSFVLPCSVARPRVSGFDVGAPVGASSVEYCAAFRCNMAVL